MIRRNAALLVGTLTLTLVGIVACHVSAECDVHRNTSGTCTVTVPPGGVDVTVITQPNTTAAGGGGGGGQTPNTTTKTPPVTTTIPTAVPTTN